MAIPLLRSLFGELSGSAKESFLSMLSPVNSQQMNTVGQNSAAATVTGTALSSLPNLLSAAPGATSVSVLTNNTNNVQAPVSIQVTASGSDPEKLGQSIYESAERYLLKSLQSVFR